jgi:hypothetical protein
MEFSQAALSASHSGPLPPKTVQGSFDSICLAFRARQIPLRMTVLGGRAVVQGLLSSSISVAQPPRRKFRTRKAKAKNHFTVTVT